LIPLFIQVDKKNLIESLFNFCALLIHFLLFTFVCTFPYTLIYPAIPHVQSLETKKKKQKRKMNIDLAIFAKSWQEQVQREHAMVVMFPMYK